METSTFLRANGEHQTAILELMGLYNESRSKTFTNALEFDAELTEQLKRDIRSLFIFKTWYTAEYMESINEDDEEAVDAILDGYDKLGNVMESQDGILFEYDFLSTPDELYEAFIFLSIKGNTKEGFNEKYSWLTMEAIQAELDHIYLIVGQMKTLIDPETKE